MALSKIKQANKKSKHERVRKNRREQARRQEMDARKKMREQNRGILKAKQQRNEKAKRYIDTLL